MIDKKELNKTLRESAIKNGLCAQWQKEWEKDWDIEHMISQFFRGLDFYLKNRFMTNDFMKENFDIDIRRSHNILVDDDYSLSNPQQALIVGNSNAIVDVNAWSVTTIYATDDSYTKVTAKDNSFVMIHLFDSAQVNINKKDYSNVNVYIHSKNAVVITDDDVKIRENLKYLK